LVNVQQWSFFFTLFFGLLYLLSFVIFLLKFNEKSEVVFSNA